MYKSKLFICHLIIYDTRFANYIKWYIVFVPECCETKVQVQFLVVLFFFWQIFKVMLMATWNNLVTDLHSVGKSLPNTKFETLSLC